MKNTGFTLIELLAAVLIIGILAAVALPQYQAAVDKSRYSAAQPVVRALKEAAEVYRLANGEYPPDFTFLDTLPSDMKQPADDATLVCGGSYCIDLYDGFAPSAAQNIIAADFSKIGLYVYYVQWLNKSSYPDRVECWAAQGNDRAAKLCRAASASAAPAGVWGGRMDKYVIQ